MSVNGEAQLQGNKAGSRSLNTNTELEDLQSAFPDAGQVEESIRQKHARISEKDLEAALGPPSSRGEVITYVCGPPAMTDWAVSKLRAADGMKAEQVLCEKWW